LIALIIAVLDVSAQKRYSAIDAKIMEMLQTASRNPEKAATYIRENFASDEDKVRAVFFWISQTFAYDVTEINKNKFYDNENQIIKEITTSGKGVCYHFATLYSYICNKAGVKTYVVDGYTSQNGKLDQVSHAWNVSFINNKWQLTDPTWGTGYARDGKFVRALNNFYFLTNPNEFIKTHCPFDPMWQLLSKPMSYYNFEHNNFLPDKTETDINFNDSIIMFQKRDSLSQLTILLCKLQKNETPNPLIVQKMDLIKGQINIYKKNASLQLLNDAIENLNKSVVSLNEYVDFYNHQFTPAKKDNLIQYMILNIESPLDLCKKQLAQISYSDPSIKYSIYEITTKADEIYSALAEHKKFVEKYISTPNIFRKSLFYSLLK